MALFDGLGDKVENAARVLADGVKTKFWDTVGRLFPGFTAELLEEGWLPIPAVLLERLLQMGLAGVAELKNIALVCRPEQITLACDVRKYAAKFQVRLTLAVEDFELSNQRGIAVLACQDELEIAGRNLLGRLAAFLAGGIIRKTLKSAKTAGQIHDASRGMVELAWPRLTVHLDRIEHMAQTSSWWGFLGVVLRASILRLGPLAVRQDHIQLKVALTWQAAEAEGDVKE